MQRSNRKRTTLTPGVVDLPRARRSSAEVSLEKKKKSDAATKKAEAKRLAAARVAELEKQAVMMATTKKSHTRPLGQASKEVSFPIVDQIGDWPDLIPLDISCFLDEASVQCSWKEEEGGGTSSGHGNQEERRTKVRTLSYLFFLHPTDDNPHPLRSSAPTKPSGFKDYLVDSSPAPGHSSDELEVIDDDDTEGDGGESENEIGYFESGDSSASLVCHTPLQRKFYDLPTLTAGQYHNLFYE